VVRLFYLSEMGNAELLPLSLATINELNSCYNVLEQHKCSTRYVKFSLIIAELAHVILRLFNLSSGDRGSTVVKVLCYKSEGRWFDPNWCQWIFR